MRMSRRSRWHAAARTRHDAPCERAEKAGDIKQGPGSFRRLPLMRASTAPRSARRRSRGEQRR